ncbi:MAG: alpha/beta hydrolase [Bryobacterales bacterium]|nr:alpha/beta hydrolase [Bryobacterales bacterium]
MTATESAFVHRFVPGAPSGPKTTLLLLHGTGGDEHDLIALGRQLLPGAALLSPRGRVLEHGMPRFFRRVAEGVFDLDDLKLQTGALAHFVRSASENYGVEGNQLIAVGYSNGANIAASLLLTHPQLLSGAVLFRPMVPFRPQLAPDLKDTPVLLAAARHDQVVPSLETAELSQILTAAGARVTIHWHPGGHELGTDDIEAAKEWLGK